MQIIHDSKKSHWAIGREVECDRCETTVLLETKDDFETRYATEDYVVFECPRCKNYQRFYKPRKQQAINIMPCDNKTTPVRYEWYGAVEDAKKELLES